MASNTVSILDGSTFVVSDQYGDIDSTPTDTTGLFSWDTRFLSRWLLTVDGVRPNSLSTDDLQYFSAQFFLVPGTGTIYVDAELSIIRKRAVGSGFHEELTILNHSDKPHDLVVHLEVGADFADLFEVKDALAKKGEFYNKVKDGSLLLGYRREKYRRETLITTSAPAEVDEHSFTFKVHIEPHGQWTTTLAVIVAHAGIGIENTTTKYHSANEQAKPDIQGGLDAWLAAAPRLVCDWETLKVTYRRSLVDLAALRFYPQAVPGAALPAAGLPWFMTVFGRDSILTSIQALPFAPELAASTLRTLAGRQGRFVDDFRDEEPGKIIHEERFGEMTAFLERPHSPYYGAADVTPLFLILLDEYERWSGDAELVRSLEASARDALTWIDKYGDRNGDGYIEYSRRNTETGLENQCWKDSWNSILFADGTNSKLPRATCEIQGYAYDAKVRCARLAREIWGDPELANRLEKEAVELKIRFNKDYWIPEREFFALALDGDGRQVDSLTSNIGHLLWSGIADEDKADACVRQLMSDRLYSGWGIRTMAEGEGGYNPIGYHVGTVWPFDCSFIALGLRRYGYREEAARIAMGILDASAYFRGRLPEAFGGYARQATEYPVEYPTACSPQAWSTGAPLLFLRTLLGLEPTGDHLLVDPAVPQQIAEIQLLDIPGRWGRVDAFGRGRVDLEHPQERARKQERRKAGEQAVPATP
jgi:glycogen debranching enzyme